MKKKLLVLVVSAFCFACNNGNDRDNDLDSLGEKVENAAERAGDSAKSTINRWEDSLDNDRDDTSRH